jgi:chitodextrinase
MPTNIRNVSFVNPLDPAGSAALQVQQQQIQRQQAIAQALQQQSMQEDKVEPGSRVSWTQGLAKLAQALAARDTYKKTDAQQVDLATSSAAGPTATASRSCSASIPWADEP